MVPLLTMSDSAQKHQDPVIRDDKSLRPHGHVGLNERTTMGLQRSATCLIGATRMNGQRLQLKKVPFVWSSPVPLGP